MRLLASLLVALVVAGQDARAHDSPNAVIHALTHRLEEEGPSPRTLTARAFEYQAIRKTEAARADLLAALRLQPDYLPALLGATEVNLLDGRLGEAVAMGRRGLAATGDAARQAPFHALLARIHTQTGDDVTALAAWREALRSPHVEIDWLVGEADCLGRLGRHDAQCEALEAAMRRNPSVVLRHAWIRALVDAGRFEQAEREVEAQLAATRWRGTWLVLQAQIAERRGDRERQQQDAAAALAELRGRFNPARPDPQLGDEIALAERLSGAGTHASQR